MELIANPDVERWLAEGPPEFDWDKGNREKNLKHAVTWEDVESLFVEGVMFIGHIVIPEYPENRFLALGEDWNGRRLALIFTIRNNKLRPISCRPMRREERHQYEEKEPKDS